MPIERRTLLKTLAVGAVAAPGICRSATGAPTQPHDVLILGGAFAGVTAARELGQRGHRCVILEARGRLGGRTFSTEVFGEAADVGGQWIHWIQPHVWAE